MKNCSGNADHALAPFRLLARVFFCYIVCASLLFGCGRSSSPLSNAPKEYVFPGLSGLKANEDGTYTLLWPASPVRGVSYRVFSRPEKGAYDFQAPDGDTSFTFYRTRDLSGGGGLPCFMVRLVSSTGLAPITGERCARGVALKGFAGVKEPLLSNGDGTYTITWDAFPYSGTQYAVYESHANGKGKGASPSDEQVFSFDAAPAALTSQTLHRTSTVPFGETRCYVVRYVKNGFPADVNTKKVCIGRSDGGTFSGIGQVLANGTGSVRITWTKDGRASIQGYKVYRGTTFRPEDSVLTLEKNASEAYIDGLVPGQRYFFGVRAFNESGRDDGNTKVLSVTVDNFLPPRFDGIASATVSAPGVVTLRWEHARGVPDRYRIYAGVARRLRGVPDRYRIYAGVARIGQNPVVDFSKAYLEVKAPATSAVLSDLGDESAYTFVVRAQSKENFESIWVEADRGAAEPRRSVVLPDAGAPRFEGIKSARMENSQLVLEWNAPLGEVKHFALALTRPGGSTSISSALPLIAGDVRMVAIACIATEPEERKAGAVTITPSAQAATAQAPAGVALVGPCPLNAGETYTVSVKAIDTHSNTDSNTKSLTVSLGDLTRPTLGGSLALVPDNENEMGIEFTPSADTDVVRYRVFAAQFSSVSGQFGDPQEKIALPTSHCMSGGAGTFGTPGTCGMAVPNLGLASRYRFTVRAEDASGNRSAPLAAEGTTKASARPDFAGVLDAAQKGLMLPDRGIVRLHWQKPFTPVSHYRVLYSRSFVKLAEFLAANPASLPVTVDSGSMPDDSMQVVEISKVTGLLPASVCDLPGDCYVEIPSLAPSERYFFAVRAVDPQLREDLNTVSLPYLVPSLDVPAAVSGVTIQNVPSASGREDFRVRFSYTQPASGSTNATARTAASFIVEARAGADAYVPVARRDAASVLGATTAYDILVAGLADNATYDVRVNAVGTTGAYDAGSNTVQATLDDRTPPAFGSDALSAVYDSTDREIVVQWNTACDGKLGSGVVKYHVVWREAGRAQAFRTAMGTPVPSRTRVVTGLGASQLCTLDDASSANDGVQNSVRLAGFGADLARNVAYEFLVIAEDARGNLSTNVQSTSTAVWPVDGTAPGFAGVRSVVLEGTGPFVARVRWTPVVSAASYRIYRRTSPGAFSSGNLIASPASGVAEFADATPADFTSYCYEVTAVANGGEESTAGLGKTFENRGFTNTVCDPSKRTPDVTRPVFSMASGNVSASIDGGAAGVRLAWTTPASDGGSGVARYVVFYRVRGTGAAFNVSEAAKVTEVNAPAANVLVPAALLNLGTHYDFLVVAVDTQGNWSVPLGSATHAEFALAANIVWSTNLPPTFVGVASLRVGDGGVALTGKRLVCEIDYTDPENDAVSPTFRFRNVTDGALRATVVLAAGSKSAVYDLRDRVDYPVASDADTRGEQVTCEATLSDGVSTTAASVSPPLTVADTSPIFARTSALSQTVFLQAAPAPITYQAIDADGDAITLSVTSDACSFVNPTPSFSLVGGVLTLSPAALAAWPVAAAGNQVFGCDVRIKVSAGGVLSGEAAAQIWILNRAPDVSSIAPSVVASPAGAFTTDKTLRCSSTGTASDADGEAVALQFQWREGPSLASSSALLPSDGTFTTAPLDLSAAVTRVGATYWCVMEASDGRVEGATPSQVGLGRVEKALAVTVAITGATMTRAGSNVTNVKVGDVLTCLPSDTELLAASGRVQWYTESASGSGAFVLRSDNALPSTSYTVTIGDAHKKIKCEILVASEGTASGRSAFSVTLAAPGDVVNSAPAVSAIASATMAQSGAGILSGFTVSALRPGEPFQLAFTITDADGDAAAVAVTSNTCGAGLAASGASVTGTLPLARNILTGVSGSCSLTVKAVDTEDSLPVVVTLAFANRPPALGACTPVAGSGTTWNFEQGLPVSIACAVSDPDIGSDNVSIVALAGASRSVGGCGFSVSQDAADPGLVNITGVMPEVEPLASSCAFPFELRDALSTGGQPSLATTVSAQFALPSTRLVQLSSSPVVSLDDQCKVRVDSTATVPGGTVAGTQVSVTADASLDASVVVQDALGLTVKIATPGSALTATTPSLSLTRRVVGQKTISGTPSSPVRIATHALSFSSNANAAALRSYVPGVSPLAGDFDSGAGSEPYPAGCTSCTTAAPASISSRYETSCVLDAAGAVRCWGRNDASQIDPAGVTAKTTPVTVAAFAPSSTLAVQSLSTGEDHLCAVVLVDSTDIAAVTARRVVRCVGGNASGQLGTGLPSVKETSLQTPLALPEGIAQVSAGARFTCAVDAAGRAWCWGKGNKGQLGTGALFDETSAQNVQGLDASSTANTALAVAAGREHACALVGGGGVSCWGDNTFNQISNAATAAFSTAQSIAYFDGSTPAKTAVAVDTGGWHTCAATASGALVCWGRNDTHQAGNTASTANVALPTAVNLAGIAAGGANYALAVAPTLGEKHSCYLARSRRAVCFGTNASRQLGDASVGSTVPRVLGVFDTSTSDLSIAALTAGKSQSCLVTRSGRVQCVGSSAVGALGLGGTSVIDTSTSGFLTTGRVGTSTLVGTRRQCTRYDIQ